MLPLQTLESLLPVFALFFLFEIPDTYVVTEDDLEFQIT